MVFTRMSGSSFHADRTDNASLLFPVREQETVQLFCLGCVGVVARAAGIAKTRHTRRITQESGNPGGTARIVLRDDDAVRSVLQLAGTGR